MPSGYEKSPDYGDPPTSPLNIRLGTLTVAALYVWQMMPAAPQDCQVIRSADVEMINKDSKTLSVLRLDKLNLQPGECVMITP